MQAQPTAHSSEPNFTKPKIDNHQFELATLYKLRHEFTEMDKDGNHWISLQEFMSYYQSQGLNMNEGQLEFNYRSIDHDNDHKIFWNEFLVFMHLNMFPCTSDEYVLKTFRGYDKNKNGKISKSEILEALKILGMDLGEEYVDQVMGYYDVDHSGDLDYAQFYCLIKRIDVKFLNLRKWVGGEEEEE